MVTSKVNFSDINNMDENSRTVADGKDNPTFNPFDNKENSNRKTNKSQERTAGLLKSTNENSRWLAEIVAFALSAPLSPTTV